MGFFDRSGLLWYIKSDIELRTTTVWGTDGVERIDGFYFMSKKPFSKSYRWHVIIGLENTYTILNVIQDTIQNKKRAVVIEITSSMGTERIVIWKGSLKKAEQLIFEMIKELQKQY